MIDHISIAVTDLDRAVAFYEPVLATLGHRLIVTRDRTAGFGKSYPEFWLNVRDGREPAKSDSGVHVALRARDEAAVAAFHAAALAHGGKCEGPPGPRPEYSPRYHAAFILDLDGNRIEAVTFVEARCP